MSFLTPSPSRPASGLRCLVVLAAAVLLGACGSGGGGTAAPAAATPARVEIVQTGLLFSERGQTRQLEARVFDADGTRLDTPVTWSSSDPSDISVGGSGLARAESRSGSTQIVAAAGDIRSLPLLAVVTTVAAGAVLVDDSQVRRGVVETDPAAAPSLDNTYSVVLSGIEPPAAGTAVIGTGSQPIAGRVVSTRAVEGGTEVTLRLAPLRELFPGLEIQQRFDLSKAEVIVPAGVSESYTVEREGDTYRFTPRSSVARSATKALGPPAGTRALFDKGCETSLNGAGFGDGTAPPFVFNSLPVLSFTLSPALDLLYTEARGLERLLLTGEPTFRFDATVRATLAFEGKVECKAELLLFRVPVGGALSAVVSILVPVGVGFEVAGKITVADVQLGLNSTVSNNLEIGLRCNGDCEFVAETSNFRSMHTPKVSLPGVEDFRVAPEFSAFGYAEAVIGNPFLNSLRFEAFELKAGPKLEGKFAPVATQVAATDFKSSYKLSLGVAAGFGDDIEAVLNILGIVEVGGEVLELTTDLGTSPTGVLTVDRDRFVTGETSRFQLKLDAATAEFLSIYNVKEIVLIRNSGGQREVARATASSGQTTFDFSFVSPNAGQTNEFTAFVVTTLLPFDLLSLELDTARASNALPVAVDDQLSVPEGSSGDNAAVLANDSDADGDTLRVSAVTQPANGQARITADERQVSYRPRVGFIGTDRFEYTVVDGKGGSASATVTVEVQPRAASVARLDVVSNRTAAGATACATTPDPECIFRGSSRQDERVNSRDTGFNSNLQTDASAQQSAGEAQGSASGGARVLLDRSDGTAQGMVLRCNGSGSFGAGREDTARHVGEASARSTASVDFTIEGEAGMAYTLAVSGVTAEAPGLPVLAGSTVSIQFGGPARSLFEFVRSSLGGEERGPRSGRLGPGKHVLSMICGSSGRDGPDSGYAGGGSFSHALQVELRLSP
ncbi:Ig-like domain-containing protein [Solimonas sp. SE-A11]|uniref:Ig-like domain-containing protein n=1 Tax=Solimonas sp. SE-A11 TaxID=3054954 RepID=UPI00259CE803|nr:Ig-like domain-containing protein [Solimonas sp. SE-A11]MDM4771570.1 Ig-like domain-containing protein [Solimonas sp. SE-A11]